jgi:hypothetical protein
MQEQDSWGGLEAGFTIEDVQFIDTNRIVMHWMLRMDKWAVCCHFSYLVVIDFYLVWIYKEGIAMTSKSSMLPESGRRMQRVQHPIFSYLNGGWQGRRRAYKPVFFCGYRAVRPQGFATRHG